jgi:hypothetical protein
LGSPKGQITRHVFIVITPFRRVRIAKSNANIGDIGTC